MEPKLLPARTTFTAEEVTAREKAAASEARRTMAQRIRPWLRARAPEWRAFYHGPSNLISFDAEGKIVAANDNAVRLIGVERGKLVGQSATDFFFEERDEGPNLMRKVLHDASTLPAGEATYHEGVVHRRDPKEGAVAAFVKLRAARDKEGRLQINASFADLKQLLKRDIFQDVFEITQRINREEDLDKVLQSIATHIGQHHDAFCAIALPTGKTVAEGPNKGKQVLRFHAAHGVSLADITRMGEVVEGEGLIGKAFELEGDEPLHVENLSEWPHSVYSELDEKYGMGDSYGFKLQVVNGAGKPLTVGTIVVAKHRGSRRQKFGQHEVDTLRLLSNVGALKIRSVTLAQKLKHQAEQNPVSGSYNLPALYDRLSRHLEKLDEQPADQRQPFAVVYGDAKRLKLLNDTFGHEEGNHALRSVAWALKQAARGKYDIRAHIHGDEFIIVLPGQTEEDAKRVIKDAQQVIEEIRGKNPRFKQVGFGADFGYKVFTHEGKTEGSHVNVGEIAAGLDRTKFARPATYYEELAKLLLGKAETHMIATKEARKRAEGYLPPEAVRDLVQELKRGGVGEGQWREILRRHRIPADQYE
ncbi:MAG: diguanylate cyclase [Candidatus Micrarchaeota archaeon]